MWQTLGWSLKGGNGVSPVPVNICSVSWPEKPFIRALEKRNKEKKKKKKKLFILWVFKKTEFLSVKLQFLTRCLCGKHSSDPPFRSLSKCRYMHAASECSPIPASGYLLSPYLALNVRYSFYFFFFFLFCKMETEVSIRLNARFPFFVMFPLKTVWNEGISEMCVDGSYWR